MIDENDNQQSATKNNKIYLALVSTVFMISTVIALSFFIKSVFKLFDLEIQRVFYWVGVAFFSIIIYPIFNQVKLKIKHIMLLISLLILTLSIAMVTMVSN